MPKKPTQAKNPKQTPGSEKLFNDKDMLLDTLISTKGLLSLYHTFLIETSNKSLYEKIDGLRKELSAIQRDLFNLMFEFGWYTLESEPQTKIQKKVTQFKNQKKQIEF